LRRPTTVRSSPWRAPAANPSTTPASCAPPPRTTTTQVSAPARASRSAREVRGVRKRTVESRQRTAGLPAAPCCH